jgi:aminoglycoside phosphotransferase (APT) family kinase protein
VTTSTPPLPEERRLPIAPDRLPSELRASILEAVPDADLEGASILGEGWGCAAYRLPAPGGDLALRVPKPASWWAVPDLEREARLLPALEAWGLPVPRGAQLLRGAGGAVLGGLQSVVEGAPAKQLARSQQQRGRLAESIGAFLARLHAFPLKRAASLGVKHVDMWEGHYAPMLERCQRLLPAASAAWLEASAQTFLDSGGVRAAPDALIHADFSGDHLVVNDDCALVGVIDWGDAMVGDPALDFAALLDAYPEGFVEAVRRAYEAHGGHPDVDAPRRARFYVDVSPIFGVLFAQDAGFPHIARADRRAFAARAAAAKRRTR